MSWRDNLTKVTHPDGRRLIGGSFRGVPFFVSESERTGGRRGVTRQFPFRDRPVVEDMGRRARVFSVEAYVIGDGYVAQKEELLAALEDERGPGELVHPYFGELRAICTNLTVRETTMDGGMATLSIEFAEAPELSARPEEDEDLEALTDIAADDAIAAAAEDLDEEYDVEGEPGFATASLGDDVSGTGESLSDGIVAAVDDPQGRAEAVRSMTPLTDEPGELVRNPLALMDTISGSIREAARQAADAPRDFLRALLDTYDEDPPPDAVGTSATREKERRNQHALAAGIRRVVICEAARVLVRIDHESVGGAMRDRERVSRRLREQEQDAGERSYRALRGLRAQLARSVPSESVRARVMSVERRVPVPSLLLSYQLYGSIRREGDLVERNDPQHPGFMSGDISALTDG